MGCGCKKQSSTHVPKKASSKPTPKITAPAQRMTKRIIRRAAK